MQFLVIGLQSDSAWPHEGTGECKYPQDALRTDCDPISQTSSKVEITTWVEIRNRTRLFQTSEVTTKQANTITQLYRWLPTSSIVFLLFFLFVCCFFGPVLMRGGYEVSWTQRFALNRVSLWTLESHINTRCKCNQVKITSRSILDKRCILMLVVNSLNIMSSWLLKQVLDS